MSYQQSTIFYPSGAITAPASLKLSPFRENAGLSVGPSGAITAPASLKHGPSVARRLRGQVPSGAITAPASLKPERAARSVRIPQPPIRGDYCPGLIEAMVFRDWVAQSGGVPSGAITAPASLKLIQGPHGDRLVADPIRGDYCPGLIEATRTLEGLTGQAVPIRGDYCPGLIEASSGGRLPCGADTPSGAITAPASLKQRRRRENQRTGCHHPGRLLPRPH